MAKACKKNLSWSKAISDGDRGAGTVMFFRQTKSCRLSQPNHPLYVMKYAGVP